LEVFLACAVATSFTLQDTPDFSTFLMIGLPLVFLIHLFGRACGAHFNPSVSLMFFGQNTLANPSSFWSNLIGFLGYASAQFLGRLWKTQGIRARIGA